MSIIPLYKRNWNMKNGLHIENRNVCAQLQQFQVFQRISTIIKRRQLAKENKNQWHKCCCFSKLRFVSSNHIEIDFQTPFTVNYHHYL